MKIQKAMLILSIVNFLLVFIAILFLPPVVPTHFNGNIIVDSVGSPWTILLVSALTFLPYLGLNLELKARGKDYKNKKVLSIAMLVVSCFVVYLNWVVFALCASGLTIGEQIPASLNILLLIPLGVIFVVIGKIYPNIRQNSTFGIKIPSTLNNEVVWDKTHRFAAPIMIVNGLVIIFVSIISIITNIEWLAIVALLSSVLVSVIVPIIYAEVKYKEELLKQNKDSEKTAQNNDETKTENK